MAIRRHRDETVTDRDHDGRPDTYDATHAGTRGAHADDHAHHEDRRVRGDAEARDRFGGTNTGAAFFGWLVAIAMTILLTSIVGAVATAVGTANDVTTGEALQDADTLGLVAAIVLVAIMLLAYYTGGYVAGRMSRFDGGRQGVAVWVIGLLVTLVAVGLGLVFGNEYNLLDRVSLPRMPVPTDQLGWAGIVTGLVILAGTLLAAMVGGKVGHRYHDKVDRVAFR